MSFNDGTFTTTMLETTLSELYARDKKKAQFTRLGTTSRWMPQKGKMLQGRRWHYYAYTQPSTGARRSSMSDATTSAFPVASQPAYTELTHDWMDLTMFRTSLKFNEIVDIQSSDLKASVFRVANRLMNQAEKDFSSQKNAAIHQDSACTMGKIKARYDADGTTYSGSNLTAYWQISEGAIRQFLPGQLLKVSSRTQAELTVQVEGIVASRSGPWASGARVADIGPGITVSIVDASSTDSDLDNADNDDTLSLSNEGAGDNFHGIPSWFSSAVDVYNDKDGSALDREALGNEWMMPEIFDYTSGGNAVDFDLETHLREVAEVMPDRVNTGRNGRAYMGDIEDVDEGVNIPKALVAITTAGIANEAIATAADTQRFTAKHSSEMDESVRRSLFGNVGFEGVVWHSPTLPPIAIQPDVAAAPEQMTIIDPQSWFWLRMAGAPMQWLGNGSDRWSRVNDPDSDNRQTFEQQAGAYATAMLVCDQPGANAQIKGVKSSTE